MRIIGIIPARYGSTRFPGKPLEEIDGVSIIQHVYNRVTLYLDNVYVATDDTRISETVRSFGGEVIMTSLDHKSGTDRCAEVVPLLETQPDIIINIQGDEPFIKPEQIKQLIKCFDDSSVEIATLIKSIDDNKDLSDHNKIKVIIDKNMDALYFSRSAIPFIRDINEDKWLEKHVYYKHIGIYGYRKDTLLNICRLDQTPLELSESLEQLRWIENGYNIRTTVTEWESIGIDTPEDIERARAMLKS